MGGLALVLGVAGFAAAVFFAGRRAEESGDLIDVGLAVAFVGVGLFFCGIGWREALYGARWLAVSDGHLVVGRRRGVVVHGATAVTAARMGPPSNNEDAPPVWHVCLDGRWLEIGRSAGADGAIWELRRLNPELKVDGQSARVDSFLLRTPYRPPLPEDARRLDGETLRPGHQ